MLPFLIPTIIYITAMVVIVNINYKRIYTLNKKIFKKDLEIKLKTDTITTNKEYIKELKDRVQNEQVKKNNIENSRDLWKNKFLELKNKNEK